MKASLGVVIPTHNRADWVGECVQSVLAQTRPADSVIVVDDGSTDGTERALAGFGDAISIERQARSGPAAAKNRGVRRSTADWILFVDSDDMLAPQALGTIEQTIGDRPDHDLFSVRALEITETGTPTGREFGKRSPGTGYTTAGLLRHDAGGCSWFAVRRGAFDAVGGFDDELRSAEECDFALRLSQHHRLFAIQQPLILRRQHGGMLSSDVELNARCWLRTLAKLRGERPDWVDANRTTFDRSWAKEHLRLARALLASDARGALPEATEALRVATTHRPFHLRSWAYRARATLLGR